MPSFELKPMGSTNDKTVDMGAVFLRGGAAMAKAVPGIDDIVWTCPRQPLPLQFEGRVPEDLWVATYDSLRARYDVDLRYQRDALSNATGGLPFIPCCVPCIVYRSIGRMGQMQAAAQASEQAWLNLAQTEQAKYAPYNVHVTLATEMRTQSTGAGSHRNFHMRKVNVGLKFEAADFPMPTSVVTGAVVTAVGPPPAMQQMDRAVDITAELERLARLYQAGALSDEEFRVAKARLLGTQ